MGSRLKNIYKLMKYRCTQPKYDKYQYYGERGISVCPEWADSFDTFREWALCHGYEEGLTLDRIDNDGNYEPDNCRWVTRKEQSNNKSTNHYLTFKGKTQSVQKWADELGVNYTMLEQRILDGWDVEKALTEPNRGTNHPSLATFNGKTQRLYEWANELGMNKNTLNNRINQQGWSVEKALTTPVKKRPKELKK